MSETERLEALKWLTGRKDRYIYMGCWWSEDPHKGSIGIVKDLYKAGAVKVECRPQNDEVTDTLYVTVNPARITKELLKTIVELDPDEFDEIEPNVFRLWWD